MSSFYFAMSSCGPQKSTISAHMSGKLKPVTAVSQTMPNVFIRHLKFESGTWGSFWFFIFFHLLVHYPLPVFPQRFLLKESEKIGEGVPRLLLYTIYVFFLGTNILVEYEARPGRLSVYHWSTDGWCKNTNGYHQHVIWLRSSHKIYNDKWMDLELMKSLVMNTRGTRRRSRFNDNVYCLTYRSKPLSCMNKPLLFSFFFCCW